MAKAIPPFIGNRYLLILSLINLPFLRGWTNDGTFIHILCLWTRNNKITIKEFQQKRQDNLMAE